MMILNGQAILRHRDVLYTNSCGDDQHAELQSSSRFSRGTTRRTELPIIQCHRPICVMAPVRTTVMFMPSCGSSHNTCV